MHIDDPNVVVVEATVNGISRPRLRIPLHEYLECFTPPQSAKIVQDANSSFNAHEAFDIPRDTSLIFIRKVSPSVPVKFQDNYEGAASEWKKVTIPVDTNAWFRLLAFDPVSGDTSPDHIYHTVSDLVLAFPLYVQANATFGDKLLEPRCSFNCGDHLKLIRLIYKDGRKFMECKLVGEPRLLQLPLACVGDFTVVTDYNTYLLADIVSLPPRRRRVQIAHDRTRQPSQVPGLPLEYGGDLFVEKPEAFIEASPVDDSSLIIGLPCDLDIMVSPDEPSHNQGQILNLFANQNRNIFPVIARVTEWEEETSILENHYVRPGVEIVIHGWTRQSKVLAISGDSHYAIPLTYTGKFRIKPKQYRGVSELERAYPGNKLKVTHVDRDDDIPLTIGDIIKIKREDTLKRKTFQEVEIRCEKYENGSAKKGEHKLPLRSTAIFEEYLEDAKNSYSIKELVSFVSDQEIMVELIQRSMDQKSQDLDIPVGLGILLCDFVVEPAVYVSVESPDAPAFHIPVRTQIYVAFVHQLEKLASPLLTKKNPRLSTMDRCVETLSSEALSALRPQRALESAHSRVTTQTPTNAWVADGGMSSGWPAAALGANRRELDLLSGKSRKAPSLVGSDLGVNKSKSKPGKLKTKFRRHKSQEDLLSSGSAADRKSEYPPLSLPRQDIEYAHSRINENVLLAERSVSVMNGQLRVATQDAYSKGDNYVGSESSADTQTSGEGFHSLSSASPNSNVIPTHTVNARRNGASLGPASARIHVRNTPAQHRVQTVNGVHAMNHHTASPAYVTRAHAMSNGVNGHPEVSPLSPQTVQVPPGYALVSMTTPDTPGHSVYSGSDQGSPGYMMVPVMSPEMLPGHHHQQYLDDEGSEEHDSGVHDVSLHKVKLKLTLPPDGNLYHFSTKKMEEFLRLLRIDDQVITNCVRNKIDGKKFSRLDSSDLQKLGIMHPVVVHFRKLTQKKRQKFML